jgi:hypothetical protein
MNEPLKVNFDDSVQFFFDNKTLLVFKVNALRARIDKVHERSFDGAFLVANSLIVATWNRQMSLASWPIVSPYMDSMFGVTK